jgi:hypothetical protein
VRKAIDSYGDPAVESVKKELMQIIKKQVWKFILPHVNPAILETPPLLSSLVLKAKT